MITLEDPEKFLERADAYIKVANKQVADGTPRDRVNDSFMHATARFNAWLMATEYKSGSDMRKDKDEILRKFVEAYGRMLSEQMDDYIQNHDIYLKPKS